MLYNHNEYLNYELPKNWNSEEDGDNLLLYNPNGSGAMVVSFFNVLATSDTLDEQISILAKKFIDKNKIKLHSSLILFAKDDKTTLYGTGTTSDGWFIKLWVVAKHPKIVFATYQSEKKTGEVKKCDSIIDSINFTF